MSPTFNSPVAGNFNIGLRVTDNDGTTATATSSVNVSDSAPVADAGGPYSGNQGTNISLDGSGSSDPSGIVSYEWDFDTSDGLQYADASGVSPTFTSALAGNFTIGLRVTDGDGATATTTSSVTVNDVAPVADAGGPYSGGQGTNIALDGSGSSDPSGIASYEWDYDTSDGLQYTDASGVSPTFNSPVAGNFNIGLRVTDNDGTTATATSSVNVSDSAPVADAGGPYSGNQGTNISLDGSGSSDPSGIVSYEWDFDTSDGLQYADASGVSRHSTHRWQATSRSDCESRTLMGRPPRRRQVSR